MDELNIPGTYYQTVLKLVLVPRKPLPLVSVIMKLLQISGTSEDTIRRVLSSYELGPKLRQLRLRKKIALVDLGKITGLSASMLSQLENGKLVPTLSTLARIAMVFDVGLDFFFGDRRQKRPFIVVQGAERLRFRINQTVPSPTTCLNVSPSHRKRKAFRRIWLSSPNACLVR